MNTTTNSNSQQPQQPVPVAVKGAEEAKKKPPKIIEKVIDSVEDFLLQPAKKPGEQKYPPQQQAVPPQPQKEQSTPAEPPTPEQAQMQGTLGGSSEYELPKGTTITLPDGKAFETQAESKITKKGGE